jgi:hypothetical protein
MLEFQITQASFIAIPLWLTAMLGVSFLLTISFLLQFVSVRFAQTSQYFRFNKLLLAVLACLQFLTWQLYYYRDSHDTVALWGVALALISGAIMWQLSNGSPAMHPLIGRALPIAFVLVSFVEFAGFAQATRQFSNTLLSPVNSIMISNSANSGNLVESTAFRGNTDSGKPIRLFERQVTNDDFRNSVEMCRSSFSAMSQMSQKAMLRAQPSVQSNCHGWVFAQGQHILMGEDVQLILNDNNYTQVPKPQANDIAVYRSDESVILHTGVVRGSLEGVTMVESKWGIGSVYMHVSEEQPYSQNISYYRTDRPSHDILISSTKLRGKAEGENWDRANQLQAYELLGVLAYQAIDNRVQRSSFDPHFCGSQRE